ncbi:hypothetical protein FF38_08001 [Lucilia cuprina]|uniref:Uncharacterized protein n=1 Tax=Lucilia cuprina TaxID=7375 RepID=A0A0L0CFM1_LUCCU|nr:hypothetical protein FF38_08001 [Lucilia cuprina]
MHLTILFILVTLLIYIGGGLAAFSGLSSLSSVSSSLLLSSSSLFSSSLVLSSAANFFIVEQFGVARLLAALVCPRIARLKLAGWGGSCRQSGPQTHTNTKIHTSIWGIIRKGAKSSPASPYGHTYTQYDPPSRGFILAMTSSSSTSILTLRARLVKFQPADWLRATNQVHFYVENLNTWAPQDCWCGSANVVPRWMELAMAWLRGPRNLGKQDGSLLFNLISAIQSSTVFFLA